MRKILGYFSEFSIFALVGLVLIMGPLNFGSRLPLSQGWLHLAVALTLPLWMMRLVCLAEPFFVWARITIPLLAVLLYVIARYLFSDVEWLSRQELLMVSTYVVLFLVILNNLQRRWQLQALFWIIALLAGAEAADGIIRHYRGGIDVACRFFFFDCVSREGFQNANRAGGTFFTPDHYAAYLEMAFVLTAAALVILKRSWVRRILLLYFGVWILVGIALSRSRGGWISLLCTVAFLVFLVMRGRFLDFRSALVGVLVLGGVVYFLYTRYGFVAGRFEDLFTQGEESRLRFYQAALLMGKDHPLFGVGPRLYEVHFGQYAVNPTNPELVHSEFLQAFADYGFVGVGLMGWLTFAFFRSGLAMSAPKKTESTPHVSIEVSQRLAFAIGGTAAVFAITVHSAFDFVLHVMGIGVTFAAIAALLFAAAALRRKRNETDWEAFAFDQTSRLIPLGSRKQWIVLACLTITFLMFFPLGLRNHLSLRSLEEGDKQIAKRIDPDPEEAIRYYESAIRLDPGNYAAAYTLASAYYQKSGGDWETQRQWFDKAVYWYEQAVRSNRYLDYALHDLAQRHLEMNQLDRARNDYEQLCRIRPLDPSYHATHAQICMMLADYDCARRQLELAMKCADPTAPDNDSKRYLELLQKVPRSEDPTAN